jgi:hypothetical protein
LKMLNETVNPYGPRDEPFSDVPPGGVATVEIDYGPARVYQCAVCGDIKEAAADERLDFRLHRGETVLTPKNRGQLLNDYVAAAAVCPDCSKKQNKKRKAAAKR